MTVLRHLSLAGVSLMLLACTPPQDAPEGVAAPEPVMAEPVVDVNRVEETCEPGTDDGIGGTGCSVD